MSGTTSRRAQRPAFDGLEVRVVPATFGIPWADARQLSLSFAPDGTTIAGHTNLLFESLDAQMARAEWQRALVRAFQTWAVHVNMNIAVVRDNGATFGTAGFAQHDHRFGDVRVGAHDMGSGALAVAVPNDPALAGTLSGDLFLNSAVAFDGAPYDLFTVALHEAGHALGLGHSTNPESPMFDRFNNTKTSLTAGDISAIRALYGARAVDAFEGASGNETIATASSLPEPAGHGGDTPLLAFGDIRTTGDVDLFRIDPPGDDDDDDDEGPDYNGRLTIRLQSAGVSSLAPRLTVLDREGRVLQTRVSTSALGATLTARINVTAPGAWPYFVRVEAATDDVFGIGGYGLAVRYDALSATPDSAIDRVLRGPHSALGAEAIDALFRDPAGTFFNPDGGANDEAASAEQLPSTPGYTAGTHFQTVASIEQTSDRDFYRITLPETTSRRVLTVTAWTTDTRGLVPRVSIATDSGASVAAVVLDAGNGRFTLQVPRATPGQTYVLEVRGGNDSGYGNYYVDAHLGSRASRVEDYASGGLTDASRSESYQLYVARSQLFRFVLAVSPMPDAPDARVRMTIRNAAGRTVLSLVARAGDVIAGSLFAAPGEYTVRFARENISTGLFASLDYALSGSDISDPKGPVVSDPTLRPMYTTPGSSGTYTYPNGTQTTRPYLWVASAL